jgi:hypothetical protein
MQHLEVSSAVRHIYMTLGGKGIIWLENLCCFLNLGNNFWFNAIWHKWPMAELNVCQRLAESDITVTPSTTLVDWWWWCYNLVAHIVSSSTTLAILTCLCEKCKNWHHLVHSKCKIDERPWTLQNWKVWMNCWRMP